METESVNDKLVLVVPKKQRGVEMPFEIEVDVQKQDRHGNVSFLERVFLPAKYNDALGAIVITYKGYCQQVSGNYKEGFYITIF